MTDNVVSLQDPKDKRIEELEAELKEYRNQDVIDKYSDSLNDTLRSIMLKMANIFAEENSDMTIAKLDDFDRKLKKVVS